MRRIDILVANVAGGFTDRALQPARRFLDRYGVTTLGCVDEPLIIFFRELHVDG